MTDLLLQVVPPGDWTNLIWEKGGNVSIAGLLLLLVYVMYQQTEKQKIEIKVQNEQRFAEMKAHYENRIAERDNHIAALEKRVEFLELKLNVK